MQFDIPCEIFARMSEAAKSVQEYPKGYEGILLEHRNFQTFVVATNVKVLAAQYVGQSNQPNGNVLLAYDAVLIEYCRSAAQWGGMLQVIAEPTFQFVSIKTSFGYTHPQNIGIFAERNTIINKIWTGEEINIWDDWRAIFPAENPKKNKGMKFLSSNIIERLNRAAPSGNLLFPENCDGQQPIVCADAEDNTWFGLVFPIPDGKTATTDVKIPGWIKTK